MKAKHKSGIFAVIAMILMSASITEASDILNEISAGPPPGLAGDAQVAQTGIINQTTPMG